MNESAAPAGGRSLAEFADHLANQQTVITEQWLLVVRRDTQIETADRMPTPELVDHLPRLLRELCEFLRTRDVDSLVGDARRDASQHGELRWRDGYKIDELVRELEAFRQLVASSVFRYRDLNPAFKGPLEVSASALIQQFFAESTVASVRQFMHEQQNVTRSFLRQLVDAQQQLGRATSELSQVRDAQQSVATGEMSARPSAEPFDPRLLFSEIVAAYKPLADSKGLQLLTECLTAPAAVLGDRARIKKIAQLLLDNAIEHTQSGRVSFIFSFPDADAGRWTIRVNDTGPGLSGEDSAQLVGGNPVASDLAPGRGMGLIVVKDLARSLGGSLQTTTQTGVGTRTEVSLPRPV